MARIAGVNIPTNKRVVAALTYIYGIGDTLAGEICKKAEVSEDKRVSDLSDDDVAKIREVIDNNYRVEGELRRDVAMNIKRLMDLGCYRGLSLLLSGDRSCRSFAGASICMCSLSADRKTLTMP